MHSEVPNHAHNNTFPDCLIHRITLYFPFRIAFFSIKIPEVTERHPRDSVPVWRSINLVFTIWAVFGGFILHFLLSNYLTVLLRPSFEEPVDTAEDLNKRNITVFTKLGELEEFWKQFFENSPNEHYRELSRNLFVSKQCVELEDGTFHLKSEEERQKLIEEADCGSVAYWKRVAYVTKFGDYATIGSEVPKATYSPTGGPLQEGGLVSTGPEELKEWYMSRKPIEGLNPYLVHLVNKKWPHQKVINCDYFF